MAASHRSIFVAAGFLDWVSGGSAGGLYGIPVVLAAVLDGWTEGLTAAVLSAAAIFAISDDQAIAANALESLAMVLLAGFLNARSGVIDNTREGRQFLFQEISGRFRADRGPVGESHSPGDLSLDQHLFGSGPLDARGGDFRPAQPRLPAVSMASET